MRRYQTTKQGPAVKRTKITLDFFLGIGSNKAVALIYRCEDRNSAMEHMPTDYFPLHGSQVKICLPTGSSIEDVLTTHCGLLGQNNIPHHVEKIPLSNGENRAFYMLTYEDLSKVPLIKGAVESTRQEYRH